MVICSRHRPQTERLRPHAVSCMQSALQLTEAQRQRCLVVRANYLAAMARIMTQRQALNAVMQVHWKCTLCWSAYSAAFGVFLVCHEPCMLEASHMSWAFQGLAGTAGTKISHLMLSMFCYPNRTCRTVMQTRRSPCTLLRQDRSQGSAGVSSLMYDLRAGHWHDTSRNHVFSGICAGTGCH